MFIELDNYELNDINGGGGGLIIAGVIIFISAAASAFNGYSDAHFK